MTKRKQPVKRRKAPSAKRKKSAQPNHFITYFLIGLIGFLIVSILMGVAGWIGYEAGKESAARAGRSEVAHYREDLQALRKKLRTVRTEPKTKVAKSEELSEIKDYLQAGGSEKRGRPAAKEEVRLKRPKLAIIIDDVAFASQLRAIRALPWHITPSFFPPSKRYPETSRIASKLDHYMIHLPMEAMNYNRPEDETLTTASSSEEIDLRLRKLRRWFSNAHFINNHTGSRFTSDMASMQRFYPIAKRYGFVFIDSRTTPKTVVPKICEQYNDPYIARDIFLDNRPDIDYIRGQLRKAVRIARSHGYAIAIGHPHTVTLEALAGAGSILKEVDVVYIDELYGKIR